MRQFFKSLVAISAVSAIAECIKIMPKGVAMACIPLLLVEIVVIPSTYALEEIDLYQLCSSFPLNSKCKGYEAPIPLDKREGKTGDCTLKNNEGESRGICKIAVNEAGITIYQEIGKETGNSQR